MANYKHIDSALIHGGIYGDALTGSVNVPIYQTSTYEQKGLGKLVGGYEYSRTGNPTRAALEALIAELEGGVSGFAFGSGMAATTAVLSLFHTGDKIILSQNVYGGTYRVLAKVFDHFGIGFDIVDTTDLAVLDKAITPEVKALFIESPANPLLTVTDIKAVADIAKKHNILTIVDNTFMTPYLQRPISLGADIVIHSATKYLGGHSDLVAGLVVVNDSELARKIAFIQNSTGGVLGPFDSFLLIRGIKTLGVRMDRHTQNAAFVAQRLRQNKAVKNIYYPGFEDAQGHDIQVWQAKTGGAMISFELYENYSLERFFESLHLVALAESLGGVESLVCHPSTMTHAAFPKDIRDAVGITENLIRLSVGIENEMDIIEDLEQAIRQSEVK
ncbi:MAG: aminotransferase class I/II-fold pyridoxal phosphate-dependent enzyme [Proteobacteria bacterium]|nr:aminotransferase class I/II-fold pyridoxal phosphate-dependent enzyme [Pseudomonadota bacterium]